MRASVRYTHCQNTKAKLLDLRPKVNLRQSASAYEFLSSFPVDLFGVISSHTRAVVDTVSVVVVVVGDGRSVAESDSVARQPAPARAGAARGDL